jgi:hypothetical protein
MNFDDKLIDLTPLILAMTIISTIYLIITSAYKLYIHIKSKRRVTDYEFYVLNDENVI